MRRSTRKRNPPARHGDHDEPPPRKRQRQKKSQTPTAHKVHIPPTGSTQQHGLHSSATLSPNSITSTSRASTLPARASTSSPNSHTSTSRAPTLLARASTSSPNSHTSTSRAPTLPARAITSSPNSHTSTSRAPTLPARASTSSPNSHTSTSRAPTLPARASTLSPYSHTSTSREPSLPDRAITLSPYSHTSTSRSPTLPARASTLSPNSITSTSREPTLPARASTSSPNSHTSTSRAPTLPARASTLSPNSHTSTSREPTLPARASTSSPNSHTSTSRAPTLPARASTSSPNSHTSTSRAPTLPARASTSSPNSHTSTSRAPTLPARASTSSPNSHTSTSRASTLPARASTSSPNSITSTSRASTLPARASTSSPNSHTSTSRAPSLPARASTSSPNSHTSTSRASTLPARASTSSPNSHTSTSRAPSLPARASTSSPNSITSTSRASTLPARASTSSPNSITSTSRAPSLPARASTSSPNSHTSTSRAPTLPARASTSSPNSITSTSRAPTLPARASTSSPNSHTSTSRAPTLPARASTSSPNSHTSTSRAPTLPARASTSSPNSHTSTSRASTLPARASTSSPNSHTSTSRASTLPARASTSSPVTAIPQQAHTAQQCLEQDIKLANRQDKMRRSTRKRKPPVRPENHDKTTLRKRQPHATPPHSAQIIQREAKRQSRSPSVATSSSRPPTPPTRAPTPPHVISIPPQVDMTQQLLEQNIPLVNEQEELEMTQSSDIEICRKAIIKNFVALKKYLHPDPIIDCEAGFGLLTVVDRKNIKGKDPTDKNETILRKVISKGAKGYTDFKERLRQTWQTDLLELIVCAENGQDTTEIESRLEKTALLCPEYIKQRGEVKDGLFEFYKTRHSKIFLSPLFEEKDTPLASFYIRPELSSILSTSTRNDYKITVKSLSEIFKFDKTENREIYVLADAGLGKTAFSKYLANVWCQAHCPDKDLNELLSKDDIDCMKEFDFLFLVLLRDSDDLCSIDELIFEKIVSNLGLEETLSKDILLKILKNEKCLIILDGLDEWSHPDKRCYRSPRSIPHRNDQKKCTILTTTRPWKLGVLDLNSCQLGKKIELTKLCYNSSVTLTKRILQRWKSYPNKDALHSDVTQLMKTINKRGNDELAFVPLLLIYTTCLWCEGVQIGDSKCDLYINIVELLLSRTIQIHRELQQSWELSSSDIPECFAEYDKCTKYYSLLMHIGKLAYYTLFNETRENTLVFDGLIARKHLTQDMMNFTLHSGMLSESTSKTVRKKFSKVSFSHKTVQEFFAAIFISSQSDAQKTVVEKCRNVQDILDMSKMCEFISGMNADLMCAISNDLMSVINGDEKTRRYRTRICYKGMYNSLLYNIQKMFMSCLQEMPESENIQLCLQDFFIKGSTEVHRKQLQRLLKQNKTNIKSLNIDINGTSSSLREIIDLFSLTDLSHIQRLDYCGDSEKEAQISRILFPSLQSVNLFGGTWRNDEENLNENMARCQNLQYLYIGDFTLSHKILETIFNFISGQKSMKELTLDTLDCKEHGDDDCKRWNLDLSQHSTLSKLDLRLLPGRLQLNISTPSLVYVTLWDINLDESSLLLSRDMVNIERVELWFIEMSARSLQNFISVLENLPQSVTVKMYAITMITPETEYDRFRENIRRSPTFHVIQEERQEEYLLLPFEFKTIKTSKE